MVHTTDEKMPDAAGGRSLILRMTAEAEIGVAYHQHLGVDGAVDIMADRASFPQSLVFENERPGLGLMALGAGFVQARHGETMRRFHDALAVRIVALHTIHFAFDDGMMLREMKFRVDFDVALEAGFRVLARIDDELSPAAAGRDVFAGRAVAGFAALHTCHLRVIYSQSRVRAGRKDVTDGRVAIEADLVANISRALNLRRGH